MILKLKATNSVIKSLKQNVKGTIKNRQSQILDNIFRKTSILRSAEMCYFHTGYKIKWEVRKKIRRRSQKRCRTNSVRRKCSTIFGPLYRRTLHIGGPAWVAAKQLLINLPVPQYFLLQMKLNSDGFSQCFVSIILTHYDRNLTLKKLTSIVANILHPLEL